MKNNFMPLIAGLKRRFDLIGRSGHVTAIRTVAVFLIIALLIPIFLFSPIRQTQAQNRADFPTQKSAPISAPPEPFTVGSAESSKLSAVSSAVVSSFFSFKDYFSAPPLPKGFENAKVPSRSEQMISSLGTSLGSIFDLVYTPAAKNNEPNISSNPTSPNLLFGQLSNAVDFDFDGDGKADIARWHASNTDWKIKKSSNGNYQTETIGSSSAVPAPGDFDGDGKTDVALFNAGAWTIRKSSDNQTITPSFGSAGDKPVVGDYDGDGTSDLAIFRPSTNTWWIYKSSNSSTVSTSFGISGDITAQGKFDGDNKTDIAVFRPSSGDWHVSGSTAGYYSFHWGTAGDIPVPADYDDDDKTDFAVFRGSTGTWYVSKSSTNYASYQSQVWGNAGDQPVPADYDGDGKADYSVWRPTTGIWYTIKSNGTVYDYQTLGVSGDIAIPSAYLKQIGGYIYSYDFAKVRLSPKNSTGGTSLYSRNFSWGTGLVRLPGRAGLDAGFGISYNSLVWTKDTTNNTIVFDADNSNVTPGFRFGFSTIEPIYFDASTGKYSYMMLTPSGARVEFRQTAASDTYETADSSYTQLKINNSASPNDAAEGLTLTVTNTSGTKMLYEWKNGAYRCQKITDRNGNYISIDHDTNGQLQTVTDTLGRVVTVNYNGDGLPGSITQTWKDTNGSGSNVTRTYAAFTYTTQAITTNFSENNVPLTVIGPGGGYSIKVLQKITFPTESNGAGPNTVFTYNTWGQVTKVTNYAADNHQLNYVKVNLPANATGSQADCPRFTETRSWVENFNLDESDDEQETVVTNSITESASYSLPGSISGTATKIEVSMTGHPHGAVSKTFVGSSGWKEGLPIATEDWANGASSLERKRWTWTNWTQDDTNLSYIQNPRVTESKVGDTTNIKRSTTEYEMQGSSTTVANYGRVKKAEVYAADGTTVWKRAETVYNDSSAYLSRRMVGLPSTVKVSGYDQSASQLKLVSMMTYAYDEGDFTSDTSVEQNITSVIKHDSAFSSSFVTGRGNLTSTTRCDTTYTTSCTNGITSSVKYDIAGNVVAQISPSTTTTPRKIKISYADSFNDTTTSRYTYAYPTKTYDPADNYSEVKYRFDTGTNVWAKSPDLNSTTAGKEITREYDAVGRLLKDKIGNYGGAYTRYEYPTNNIQSVSYSTLVDVDGDNNIAEDEVYSESWTDGAGRVRKSRTAHPGSTGGWTGSLVEYDILGQVKRASVPTEIDSSYAPAGDDATRGWLWKQQEYDWKGRVTRTINPDGTDELTSYDGCGCAGGQITSVQGELVDVPDQTNTQARRTQKIYDDILGRTYKIEALDWSNNVYSTIKTIYNGRDQALTVTQYAGNDSSSDNQVTTQTYDGYGRLITRHLPEQDSNANTTYTYNQDDSVSTVTDARGAATSHTYNSRGLIQQTSYSVPQNSTIAVTPTVTISYDNIGNPTQMTDGMGTVSYTYNELSQMTSETRAFTDSLSDAPLSNNSFKIEYTYTLSGQLKSIKDPFGQQFNYAHDKTGRLNTVTGSSSFSGVTNYLTDIKYRAWNSPKEVSYGNGTKMQASFNDRLEAADFTLTKVSNGTNLMRKSYQYNEDGHLSYVQDLDVPKFDRSFKYDFGLRLNKVRTGAEARGQTESDPTKIPFREDYTQNAFGQLTERTGDWKPGTSCENNSNFDFTYSYQNNRNTGLGWSYDADGRTLHGTGIHSKYDARGKLVYTFSGTTDYYIDFNFDGNGQEVKRTEIVWNPQEEEYDDPASKYYIRATPLGGDVITEVTQSGSKKSTFVFAGGEILARQEVNSSNNQDKVFWEHWDASRNSRIYTDANGNTAGLSMGKAEIDPLGNNSNNICLPSRPNRGHGTLFFERTMIQPVPESWLSYGTECYVDGSPMLCEQAAEFLSHMGEDVFDVQFLDMPVFSDIAGRYEVAEVESMINVLRAEPNSDSILIETKSDDENRNWEVTVKAGEPTYKLVSEKASLSNKVINRSPESLPSKQGWCPWSPPPPVSSELAGSPEYQESLSTGGSLPIWGNVETVYGDIYVTATNPSPITVYEGSYENFSNAWGIEVKAGVINSTNNQPTDFIFEINGPSGRRSGSSLNGSSVIDWIVVNPADSSGQISPGDIKDYDIFEGYALTITVGNRSKSFGFTVEQTRKDGIDSNTNIQKNPTIRIPLGKECPK